MFLQTATSVSGSVSPKPDDCLFMGCPSLVGATIRYARDQEIHGEKKDAKFIYRVASGALRRFKLLSDGRRQISSFHLPGDFFGFESGPTYRLTAEAIVDTVLVRFERGALENIAMHDVRTARQLCKLTAHELDHAVDHMLLLGRKTPLEKVTDFLFEMDARMGTTRGTELPMQRRDIADYLGLTVETVSRTISRLETENVIKLVAARQIKLLTRFSIDEMQNVVPYPKDLAPTARHVGARR